MFFKGRGKYFLTASSGLLPHQQRNPGFRKDTTLSTQTRAPPHTQPSLHSVKLNIDWLWIKIKTLPRGKNPHRLRPLSTIKFCLFSRNIYWVPTVCQVPSVHAANSSDLENVFSRPEFFHGLQSWEDFFLVAPLESRGPQRRCWSQPIPARETQGHPRKLRPQPATPGTQQAGSWAGLAEETQLST